MSVPVNCNFAGTGLLQMIIRHPNDLSQDLDSISRTFLEQFALVKYRQKWKAGTSGGYND